MIKTYLTGVTVGKGMFSNENIVTTQDYQGNYVGGFFDKEMVGSNELEVRVLESKGDLALISPARGQEFMDTRHITVEKKRLRYAD